MLFGQYQYSIDPKGRTVIPAAYRSELGEAFVITKGLDNCLFVYSMNEWKKLEENIAALPLSKSRDLQRFLFASAAIVEPDKQGRILIPNVLREYAFLEKDIVIIGVSHRAEIWSSENWKRVDEKMTSDDIAAAMEELGF